MGRGKFAGIEPFKNTDSRIGTKFPVKLAVGNIDGVNKRGAVLQKTVGKTTAGSADISALSIRKDQG